jgi:hypothetical protein
MFALSATVSGAQDDAIARQLIATGYLLSAESARLKVLREDIDEIRRKKMALIQENSPEMCQISMLITNLFWVETVCKYESLLLNSLRSMSEAGRLEQYKLQYSRLKNHMLRRMYVNFKSTQSNLANIVDREILALSENVKKEMLKVLKLIEEEIDMLHDQIRAAN